MRFAVPYACPMEVVLPRCQMPSKMLVRRTAFVDVLEVPERTLRHAFNFRVKSNSVHVVHDKDGGLHATTYGFAPKLPADVLPEMPRVRRILADHQAAMEEQIAEQAGRSIYMDGTLFRRISHPFLGIRIEGADVHLDVVLDGCPPSGYPWSFPVTEFDAALAFATALPHKKLLVPDYIGVEPSSKIDLSHDPAPGRILHAASALIERNRAKLASMTTTQILSWSALRDELVRATAERPFDIAALGAVVMEVKEALIGGVGVRPWERAAIASTVEDLLVSGSAEDMAGIAEAMRF